MAIARDDGRVYVKGAVEVVLPLCVDETEDAAAANTEMAARGLRVLAVAMGQGEREERLELLGLVGIADPPRTEAIEAVSAARRAGIQTVMITGDHAVTAGAIARELGIVRPGESPDELVHARATPDDKLAIVRRWKARGAIVAMTGDGVNDAPALREAHIGVAMGKTGTEVTREASDMVLADDNFASIVAAIREGRAIFDNIRKTLVYLLTGGAAELSVMLAAAVVALPAPLLPLQLLWINLVTQGLPALALVMDPTSSDVLDRAPRNPNEPMLGGRQWAAIAAAGVVEAALVLGVFIWGLHHRDAAVARALTFSVLVFSELFRAFAARSPTYTYFQVGAFTNLRLVAVIVVSVLVQLGVQQIPALRSMLEVGELSATDTLMALGLGLVPVTVVELFKLLRGFRARFVSTRGPGTPALRVGA
jgi:P-type Ca2+ transporter type 2C